MIALGLSDPGSGKGAGQVLREPLWETEQALVPADARLHGREELAFASAFNSTQNGGSSTALCVCSPRLCPFCVFGGAQACVTGRVFVRQRLETSARCAFVFCFFFPMHDRTYRCVHV